MSQLDGSFTGVTIQAGNTTAETITLSFVDMASSGLSIHNATVATQSDAKLRLGLWTRHYRLSLKSKRSLVL